MKSSLRRVACCVPDKAPQLLCPSLQPVAIEHENPWFRVLSRGGYYTFEYERPQVVVLPIVDDKDILMIRVERPVIGDWPLELPAGDSLCGEKPIDAAVREFGEETGIRIENKTRFIPDLDISEMPGRIPVLLSVFTVHITRNEYDLRGKRDPEIHSIELVPIRDAAKRILSGDIYIGVPCAIISRLVFKRMLYETR